MKEKSLHDEIVAVLVVVFVLVIVLFVNGCAFFKGKAGTDLKACASNSISTAVENLYPTVKNILTGKINWLL